MFGKRGLRVVPQGEVANIDKPRPNLRGLRFGGGGHSLGFAAVGTSHPLALDSIAVNELVVPILPALSYTGHCSSSQD